MEENVFVWTFLILCCTFIHCEGLGNSDVNFKLLLEELSSIGETKLKESLLADLKGVSNDDTIHEQDPEFDLKSVMEYVAPETESCKDEFRHFKYCLRRRLQNKCWAPRNREHSMKWCANTCGYCNCRNWKYHCCPDIKTRADGPHQKGCPKKLCYDKMVGRCMKIKNEDRCDKNVEDRNNCAWSCDQCHRPAPSQLCKGRYGCCWDGKPALGPNNQGCNECRDYYSITCARFGKRFCNTGAYHSSVFMERHCPGTCERCGECFNKIGESKCRKKVLFRGCNYSGARNECAKYCGFCEERPIEADMEFPWI